MVLYCSVGTEEFVEYLEGNYLLVQQLIHLWVRLMEF